MAMSYFNIILNLKSLKITKKLLSKGKQLSRGLVGFHCVHYCLIYIYIKKSFEGNLVNWDYFEKKI